MATLIINRNDSRCGECKRGANPDEKTHDTVLGFNPDGEKGCGVEWDEVASFYTDMKKRVMEMRPDLKWAGME